MVWGKPQIQIVQNPSDEFGDLEGMNRTDESKLISNLKTCTSGATANNQAKNPDSFIFFTEIFFITAHVCIQTCIVVSAQNFEHICK